MQKNSQKKPLLKKVFKTLKRATKAVGITLFMAATAIGVQQYIVKNQIDQQNYKTTQQINLEAEQLGVDMSVPKYQIFFNAEYNRLKHNNGEPIYVSIASSFNEREQEVIKTLLDNYNTYFSEINPNYHFDVVSEFEVAKQAILGKTVITFSHLGMNPAEGASIKRPNIFNPEFLTGSTILINPKAVFTSTNTSSPDFAKNESHFYMIVNEEFLHALGFGDTYYYMDSPFYYIGAQDTTNIVHGETVINNLETWTSQITDLYPEDYKRLDVLYYQGNETLEERQARYDTYEKKFFQTREQAVLNMVANEKPGTELVKFRNRIGYSISTDYVFSFKTKQGNTYSQDQIIYRLDVTFADGKINFKLTDKKTGELKDDVTANYIMVNGTVCVSYAYFSSGVQLGNTLVDLVGGGSIGAFVMANTTDGVKFYSVNNLNRKQEYNFELQKDLSSLYSNLSPSQTLSNETQTTNKFSKKANLDPNILGTSNLINVLTGKEKTQNPTLEP